MDIRGTVFRGGTYMMVHFGPDGDQDYPLHHYHINIYIAGHGGLNFELLSSSLTNWALTWDAKIPT